MPLLPNQDDVLYKSGIRGVEAVPVYSQPDVMTKSSSGSASVDFGRSGANVDGSATSGDSATLSAFHNTAWNNFSEVHTMIGFWTLGDSLPFTDDFELGLMETSVNVDGGAYLDFTTEEYHAASTTAAATLPVKYRNCLLRIEQDFDNNETRFSQVGEVNEKVTIADVDEGQQPIAQYVSNGAGEGPPAIAYYRTVFVE